MPDTSQGHNRGKVDEDVRWMPNRCRRNRSANLETRRGRIGARMTTNQQMVRTCFTQQHFVEWYAKLVSEPADTLFRIGITRLTRPARLRATGTGAVYGALLVVVSYGLQSEMRQCAGFGRSCRCRSRAT
ncbi:hypothetical protein BN2475_1030007 [Paraburkholderia ribeironis]|uniref:Uncharacterized protein n=1 Tax=Paraburkholderia ribeironis TaxID=1247936 RepID=A0A1N7SM41_9BURK|nr:hypothetical protein BN2475_1030007 [Paraburkholderia ribeironis]